MAVLSIVISPTLYLFGRLLIGGLFCLGGAVKLRESLPTRILALDQFVPLPSFLTRAVALLLPWVELAVGGTLVLGLGDPWVTWISLLLLVVMTEAIALNLMRGRQAPCFCFGQGDTTPVTWITLVRNLVLLCLNLNLLASPLRLLRLQDLLWHKAMQLDGLSVAVGLQVGLLLILGPILFQIVEQLLLTVRQERGLRRRVRGGV